MGTGSEPTYASPGETASGEVPVPILSGGGSAARHSCSPAGVSLSAAYGRSVKKVERARSQRQAARARWCVCVAHARQPAYDARLNHLHSPEPQSQERFDVDDAEAAGSGATHSAAVGRTRKVRSYVLLASSCVIGLIVSRTSTRAFSSVLSCPAVAAIGFQLATCRHLPA